MKLYSTLDKGIVEIQPIKQNQISIYSCGPTVYYRMHIGNIRAYVNWDILHRALIYLGYDVKRVMNFTDVGHMSHDEDFGEDKMDREAEKEGITAIDVANKYIDTVLDDFRALNILAPNGQVIPAEMDYKDVENYGWMRATNNIDRMIELVQMMEKNGYTYETEQAVYFDVTKIPDYTIFTGQKLEDKEVGVREEVGVDPNKKHPADFVLWMKRVGKYADHEMHWESPWGVGFPGWHIECSAMGTKALGEQFDIHTGGIDHIPVHHPNERAQNIGAFGQPVVKYWIHNEWVVTKDDAKLSKSENNADDLLGVVGQGYDPLDLRYLFASTNYHTKLQFSREALDGARNARRSINGKVAELGDVKGDLISEYVERFKNALNNNLNMSEVMAIVNELLKSNNSKEDILATILDFDRVLGLNLNDVKPPFRASSERSFYTTGASNYEKAEELFELRKRTKENKDYAESDRLRSEIENCGFDVIDTPEGSYLKERIYAKY